VKITLKGIILVGAAYGIGYVQGVRSADSIGDGLTILGEGLKDLAKEFNAEFGKDKDDIIDVEPVLTNAQIHEIRILGLGGVRSNAEIARSMSIDEDLVRQVLDGEINEVDEDAPKGPTIIHVDEDDDPQTRANVFALAKNLEHPRTAQEIADTLDLPLATVEMILQGGERPDDPGSDAT